MIKPGVDLRGLQPQMAIAYTIASWLYWSIAGTYCTITSGSDSHTNGLHPKGLALDLRTNTLLPEKRDQIYRQLKVALGPQFDVVFEPDEWENGKQVKWQHVHVEFDPKTPAKPEEA